MWSISKALIATFRTDCVRSCVDSSRIESFERSQVTRNYRDLISDFFQFDSNSRSRTSLTHYISTIFIKKSLDVISPISYRITDTATNRNEFSLPGTRRKILILRSFCTDRYSFEHNLTMIRWRTSWYRALKPGSRSKPATSCRSSARTIIIGGKRRRTTRPVPRGWYLLLNFRNDVSLTWQWKRTSKNKVTFEMK